MSGWSAAPSNSSSLEVSFQLIDYSYSDPAHNFFLPHFRSHRLNGINQTDETIEALSLTNCEDTLDASRKNNSGKISEFRDNRNNPGGFYRAPQYDEKGLAVNQIQQSTLEHLKDAVSHHAVTLVSHFPGEPSAKLISECFPDFTLVSGESIKVWNLAENLPREFFSVYQTPLIFDACERVPGFLRYLSDELPTLTGPLILIGNPDPIPEVLLNSPQFSRICLFPTAWPETESFPPIGEDVSETGTVYEMPAAMAEERTAAGLARTRGSDSIGSYSFWSDWMNEFIRDTAISTLKVRDQAAFFRFLKTLAASAGQGLNARALAKQSGVTAMTAGNWIQKLKSQQIIQLIQPVPQPENHRHIRRPKLLFTDTGFAAYLLDVSSYDIHSSPYRDALLENAFAIELMKRFSPYDNAEFFYYQDTNHIAVDLICELSGTFTPIAVATDEASLLKKIRDFRILPALGLKTGLPALITLKSLAEKDEVKALQPDLVLLT